MWCIILGIFEDKKHDKICDLRIGELHELFAQCRCIGKLIEDSGLDSLFVHSEIYGPGVVQKVLEGKHMKRCVNAALVLYCCIYDLFLECFMSKQPELATELRNIISEASSLIRMSADSNLKDIHVTFAADLRKIDFSQKFKKNQR